MLWVKLELFYLANKLTTDIFQSEIMDINNIFNEHMNCHKIWWCGRFFMHQAPVWRNFCHLQNIAANAFENLSEMKTVITVLLSQNNLLVLVSRFAILALIITFQHPCKPLK